MSEKLTDFIKKQIGIMIECFKDDRSAHNAVVQTLGGIGVRAEQLVADNAALKSKLKEAAECNKSLRNGYKDARAQVDKLYEEIARLKAAPIDVARLVTAFDGALQIATNLTELEIKDIDEILIATLKVTLKEETST